MLKGRVVRLMVSVAVRQAVHGRAGQRKAVEAIYGRAVGSARMPLVADSLHIVVGTIPSPVAR